MGKRVDGEQTAANLASHESNGSRIERYEVRTLNLFDELQNEVYPAGSSFTRQKNNLCETKNIENCLVKKETKILPIDFCIKMR